MRSIIYRPSRNGSRVLRNLGLAALTSATVLACVAASASAAIIHEFLPAPTAELIAGVPAGCGTGDTEPPCISGGLSGVSALTADSEHHLWAAERIENGKKIGATRADAFDDQTGKFVPAGAEASQLDEEAGVVELDHGVAVGHPGGEREVYVGAAERETVTRNVVAVFGPTGRLQHAWTGAATPAEAFGVVRGVAVSTTLGPSENDVFVATDAPGGSLVDVFVPSPGGDEPAGVLGQIRGPETPCTAGAQGCVNSSTGKSCTPEDAGCVTAFVELHGVAVSPLDGDVFVADGASENCAHGVAGAECVIDVFEPSGVPGAYTFAFKISGPPSQPFEQLGALSADGAGDVYAIERHTNAVDEFDAEGRFLTRIAGTPQGSFKSLQSVAADPSTGELYVGDKDPVRQTGVVDAFAPGAIVPDLTTTSGEARVKPGSAGEAELEATLTGTVNPLGEGPATCAFAWGASRAFGQLAKCEAEVPEGNSPAAVRGTIGTAEGLLPDTTYFFRLQATNKNGTNPGEEGEDRELHTPGPGIHSESAREVASTSAYLDATIDPNGSPTSYYFQYGPSSAYGSQAPATPVPLGSPSGDVAVSPQLIQGLSPQSEYHYRVVAVSTLEVAGRLESVTFLGPDRTFTTQPAAGGGLPDGRRWEMVSPPDKHGGKPSRLGSGSIIQAASSGSGITYVSNLPSEEGVKGYVFGAVQVLATRGAHGWSSSDISLPHSSATGLNANGAEYRAFTPDLCSAVVEPHTIGFTSLLGEAFPPDTEATSYVRHDCSCPSAPEACFTPVLTGAPGYADVAEGTKFGQRSEYMAASADASQIVLSSHLGLTGQGEGTDVEDRQLFEWSAAKPPKERLSLVSVLPPNEKGEELPLLAGTALLGYDSALVRHAVSDDGSRVVWEDRTGHLYVRDMVKHRTVQLDLPEAACAAQETCFEPGEPANALFSAASADGSRILFTDTQHLTLSAGRAAGAADLYQCTIEETSAGRLTCRLEDLTPAPSATASADVRGVAVGVSEDAAWVYFVANGVLGDGAARGASPGSCVARGMAAFADGLCNLYVYHDGETHFIATLSGLDEADWARSFFGREQNPVRASANGEWLAFMSLRGLTGYDNRDAVSGKPDEEVYLYHAQTGGPGRLTCASCNPSGARPFGVERAQLDADEAIIDPSVEPEESTWIAANLPGATGYNGASGNGAGATYESRALSDSGRLFFNSRDALVPRDGNSTEDVYEFEPAGVGDCVVGSSGFDAGKDGCVGLISSGLGSSESGFLDASETGDDVFFLTAERLAPADVDSGFDVYDAHVCSSASPCTPEATSPPPCATADGCRAAQTEQPSTFGAPSSATFSGQGNLVRPPSTPPSKPAVTNRQRLAKALAACRHEYKHAKKRRSRCERQARARYEPRTKSKHTARGGTGK